MGSHRGGAIGGLAQRSKLGAVITELPPARWPEIEQALLVACGFRVD